MNIFVLDRDPFKAAQYHCDKHVVKMLLETAQILCTVANERGFQTQYKSAHKNHPCTKWAGEHYGNYSWLSFLGVGLVREYKKRYGKKHKSAAAIDECIALGMRPFELMKHCVPSEHVICMPDFCKISDDPVECYRYYYAKVKKKFAKWKTTGEPEWYVDLSKKLYGDKEARE